MENTSELNVKYKIFPHIILLIINYYCEKTSIKALNR